MNLRNNKMVASVIIVVFADLIRSFQLAKTPSKDDLWDSNLETDAIMMHLFTKKDLKYVFES